MAELQKIIVQFRELEEYRNKTFGEREEWKRAVENLKERAHYAQMLEG